MSKEQISSFLKQLRKTSGLSTHDVVYGLRAYDFEISPKTLYGYERGTSQPNADMFLALCKIYNCENPMELLGDTSITPDESRLIQNYRSLSPHVQETIRLLIDRELDSNTHN